MAKALIIDDNVMAAQALQFMLEKNFPSITDIRTANRLQDGKHFIENYKPDLVFLDIIMPEKNGFDFLKELANINFEIIFTTAYHEYAIQAIRFSALDYLLKPISIHDLQSSIDRFFAKRLQQLKSEDLIRNLIANFEETNTSQFKLAIPTIQGVLFIRLSEIIHLEADSNYTKIHMTDNRKYISAKTLKEYQEILNQHHFLRIHKSHLINPNFVLSYLNEGQVQMTNETYLPVSRQRKKDVATALKRL